MTAWLTTGLENVSVVHELNGRIRLRAPVLGNPALDTSMVESHLEAVPGVRAVRINQVANSLVVEYDPDSEARNLVFDVLSSFSHTVFYATEEIRSTPDLINVYWAGTMWAVKSFLPGMLKPVSAILGAAPTLITGLNTLVTKGLKVEVLDAAVLAMLISRKDYLTAGVLSFMLTLGHYLEESTEYRSDKLLQSLIKPDLQEVWVLDGLTEKKIPFDDLQVGSLVIVGPGEMLPVDGIIHRGEGTISQASLTGESLPIAFAPGDQVYSGTVIIEGKLVIKAEKVGAETTTARIKKFLCNSLKNNSRAEIEAFKMADRMVPVTFGVGLGVLALTRDIRRASAVLSVDYSCALKLVTPTAIKASMYKAAQEGILIKGAQALEGLAGINTIIFDKTGTLTQGSLKVTKITPYRGYAEEDVLRIAASAEEHYSHPIANAVVLEAERRSIQLESTGDVDFIIAHGVSAYVGTKKVMVGSYHFIAEDEGIDCACAEEEASAFRRSAHSVLYVTVEGALAGIIAMRDNLRPEARQAIEELKKLGVHKVVMLTGDHKDAALQIGNELGIDSVFHDLKPEDKAAVVKKLKTEGCLSAFVGDGVNDAPALLSAQVGISLPEGSDLARDAAQILLLRNDLYSLVRAKRIADETLNVIRKMFKTNVGINTTAVLLSAFGLLSPLQASLLHNGTTVSTLIYALSLAGQGWPGVLNENPE